jgi:hypothetical protein
MGWQMLVAFACGALLGSAATIIVYSGDGIVRMTDSSTAALPIDLHVSRFRVFEKYLVLDGVMGPAPELIASSSRRMLHHGVAFGLHGAGFTPTRRARDFASVAQL